MQARSRRYSRNFGAPEFRGITFEIGLKSPDMTASLGVCQNTIGPDQFVARHWAQLLLLVRVSLNVLDPIEIPLGMRMFGVKLDCTSKVLSSFCVQPLVCVDRSQRIVRVR